MSTHPPPAQPQSPLFYRINALLHTLQTIARQEDHLCTLLHAVKHAAGDPTPAVHAELLTFLDELPSAQFQQDLDTLRDALTRSTSTPRKTAPKRPKTSAKPNKTSPR